jgi:glycosyltransferase involved in cell wall biosynthesis
MSADGSRLAIVVPSLATGVRYWAPYMELLLQQGLQVQMFTGVPPEEHVSFPLRIIKGKWILVRPNSRPPRTVFIMSPLLIPELLRWRPDLIMTVEYTIATAWCLLAARMSGSRAVIYQEHRNQGTLSRGRRAVRRRLGTLADGVIANTLAAHEEIVQILGIDPGKVVDIPILTPPSREVFYQQPIPVGTPSARPLFLCVGQLIPRKNMRTLLQAAQLLRRQGLEFSVWIVGEGPLRQPLEEDRDRLALRDTVSFLGSVPYSSIGFIYESCDVFVMPTNFDYRCVAVLEAMRFGKAVIDSKLDGNAGDTVRHGDNGLVFDPVRADDLAQSMAAFVRDRRLVHDMGNRSAQIMDDQSLDLAIAKLTRLVRRTPDD